MPAELRGLTLWRPWPECFLLGHRPKRVENRPWYPQWAMGPWQTGVACGLHDSQLWLALHAGQRLDREALQDLRQVAPELQEGRPGEIVAVCWLARVLDVEELHRLSEASGHLAEEIVRNLPWICGPYAWEVDQVRALPEPVPCKGAQGLWKLPPEVLEQVRRQYAGGMPRRGGAAAAARRE
jgi:hypothetical protein